jgi:hypothetical protein
MLWPHSCCIKTRTKQGRKRRKRRTLCIHQVGHGLVGNVHVQRAHATTTITSAERYAMRRYYIMRCTHTQESCDIPSCSLYSFSFDLFLFLGLFPFQIRFLRGEEEEKRRGRLGVTINWRPRREYLISLTFCIVKSFGSVVVAIGPKQSYGNMQTNDHLFDYG